MRIAGNPLRECPAKNNSGKPEKVPFTINNDNAGARGQPIAPQAMAAIPTLCKMMIVLIYLFRRFYLLTALGGQFTFMLLKALCNRIACGWGVLAEFGNVIFTGLMGLYFFPYDFSPFCSSSLHLRCKNITCL